MNKSPGDTAGRVAVDHTVADRAAGIDTGDTAVEGTVAGDTVAEGTVAAEDTAAAEGIAAAPHHTSSDTASHSAADLSIPIQIPKTLHRHRHTD